MFRKVAQGFTNAATKPVCFGPFQRSLPQQESALPNAYESNDRNVAGLSYKKDTTKVQQLETFPTQYIEVSKSPFSRIPVGGSSGIAKPSLGGDVQFKKLRDVARLNTASFYSESQPVSFGASQQTVKNILAERKKSDILSEIWGLMQNPISHSFREGEMVKGNEQDASKNQQLATPKSENKERKDKNQQLEALKSENESKSKLESQIQDLQTRLKSANEELKNKTQQLEELKNASEELKMKLQEFKNVQAQLTEKEGEVNKLNGQVVKFTEEKNQLDKDLNSTKQSLNEKDNELENIKTQFAEKERELNSANQRALQLEQGQGAVQQQLKALEDENNTLKIKLQESENKIQKLEELKSENKELKTKLQESENKIQKLEELKSENKELKTKLQESENKIQKLEALKSENESQVKDLQKQLERKNKELENNKDSKPSAVNAQGVKSKVNYASASFILSGVCAVGASLATPYLAICAILAVAASVFLALGCHCLYKANTALSDVKVDQSGNQLEFYL